MNNEWHLYDMNLYRDSFQNYKVYQIPKAQLIIADVPYNLGTNAYGSNPSWYVGGDNKNGIKLSPMYTEGGMRRTGCMFCPVPIAHNDMKNIEYARTHHPKMYDAMMHKFGLADMLKKCMEAE